MCRNMFDKLWPAVLCAGETVPAEEGVLWVHGVLWVSVLEGGVGGD